MAVFVSPSVRVVPLLALGLVLGPASAWAEDGTGAPGAWRGRQITTPPPPPLPAAPAGVAATSGVSAPGSVWAGPAPAPQPHAATAGVPQAEAQEALKREAGSLLNAPYREPAPAPVLGRGIDRVVPQALPAEGTVVPNPDGSAAEDPALLPGGIDPYQQVSYTAYTLDFGEVELGIGRLAVGVAPRVQLSTNPVLDGIGAWNLALKADVIRAGPADLGLAAAGYQLADPGGFDARWLKLGGQLSVIVVPRWSLHFGGSWDYLSVDGLPQYGTLRPLLWSDAAQREAGAWLEQAEAQRLDLRIRQGLVSLRVATDLRLTERDSLVLQASAIPVAMASQQASATVRGQMVAVPPVLQLQELLLDTQDRGVSAALADSYLISVAYQASWDHLQLRLGWGTSATELAWLLQTFELGWRFGGKQRSSSLPASRSPAAEP